MPGGSRPFGKGLRQSLRIALRSQTGADDQNLFRHCITSLKNLRENARTHRAPAGADSLHSLRLDFPTVL